MTLKQWLSEQKLAPAAFAAQIGVSRQLVDRWLKRMHKPNYDKLMLITEATDGAVSLGDWPARKRNGKRPPTNRKP